MTSGAIKKTLCIAVSFSLAGCATAPGGDNGNLLSNTFANPDPCSNNARNVGLVLGATLGALAGKSLSDNKSGALAGALLGGLAGGLIGADMDHKRCELARIAKRYELDMKMSTITDKGVVIDDAALRRTPQSDAVAKSAIGMVVSLRDQGQDNAQFESNSEALTPRAREYFAAIAENYNASRTASAIANPAERNAFLAKARNRRLLLVGHTDDTGNSKQNAVLSERRARAVGRFLAEHGVEGTTILYQGAGESFPVADNRTEEGRAQNRRVELVELADEKSLDMFLSMRVPRYEFYRPHESDSAPRPEKPAAAPARGGLAQAPAKAKPAAGDLAQAPAKAKPPTATDVRRLDFGGVPYSDNTAALNVGATDVKRPWFSLISPAYASEPAVLNDCTRDRPRAAGAVRALANGAEHRTAEHIPGLYGKTWTEQVNGHRVVINKVAVLADDAALAQLPELKVYASYNPAMNRNPAPDVEMKPEVNTYLGANGLLYRIFARGNGGVECVDVLFNREGGGIAKAGKIVYARGGQRYVADFKPRYIN